MAIKTYEQLHADVVTHNHIRSYEMSVLRDVHGAGKLGTTVIHNISKELALKGLGHFGDLKLNQWERVKIYNKVSTIGKIIAALHDDDPKADEFLQTISDARDRARTIERLKELVEEL
ncbi:MAG: hypothetical protein ACLQIQ_15515 [Beijerinckiaceae bacterium]